MLNNCMYVWEKNDPEPYLTLYTKINSTWVMDLNVKFRNEASRRNYKRIFL